MNPEKMPPKENEGRRIYLTGDFDEPKAEKIVTSLLDMEAKDPLKDIVIYIDSYGGYVDSFVAIHDVIKMLRCKVATVCIGKAMSCGSMLLMSGTPGLRFMTPNARILIHEISSGAWGSVSQLDNEIEETKRLQKMIRSMILEYTDISEAKLKKMFTKDSYFTAEQAKRMGVVDKIIKSNAELHKRLKL